MMTEQEKTLTPMDLLVTAGWIYIREVTLRNLMNFCGLIAMQIGKDEALG